MDRIQISKILLYTDSLILMTEAFVQNGNYKYR